MMSVRRRLLLGTASATIVVFAAAACSIYLLTRHFLIAKFDAALLAKAHAIASMIDFDDDSPARLDVDDAQRLPEFQIGDDPEYFQIVPDEGTRVTSATLGDGRLDVTAGFVQLPGGRRGRAMSLRQQIKPDEDEPPATQQGRPVLTVTVAKATTDLDRVLARLGLLLALVCGVATTTLLVMSALLIRSALGPLDRVARQIAEIRADDLGARIDVAAVPRELLPVVSRLNDLLGRLESAFDREKCFTADAAHELRTPLAGVQAALEVCASQKRDVRQYEKVVQDCLRVARQMHAMIDSLLLLARADADRVPVATAPVDVAQLVRESWESHRPLAEQRRLQLEFSLPAALVVQTDREKLGLILSNVLSNAVQYADEAGRVSVAASMSGGSLHVEVANTGSRVRAEDADRVFDRFWRADASRSANGREEGSHCGLGLAECRKLVTAMGGRIRVQSAVNDRFVLTLQVPDGQRHSAAAHFTS